MPLPDNILTSVRSGELKPSETAKRSEKLLGSNCVSVQLLSFEENGMIMRVISKKSRLEGKYLTQLEEEYRKLRHHLGEIIPKQSFFVEKSEEFKRDMITAFCVPVTIAYDPFTSEENWQFLLREREIEVKPYKTI